MAAGAYDETIVQICFGYRMLTGALGLHYGLEKIGATVVSASLGKCINSVFEKHGIARAAWSYKGMDFGLSDSRMDTVREEIVRYL